MIVSYRDADTEALALGQRVGRFVNIETVARRMWESIPLPRSRFARQFRSLSDDDLLVQGATLITRP